MSLHNLLKGNARPGKGALCRFYSVVISNGEDMKSRALYTGDGGCFRVCPGSVQYSFRLTSTIKTCSSKVCAGLCRAKEMGGGKKESKQT